MNRMDTSRHRRDCDCGDPLSPFTDCRYQRNCMASASVKLFDLPWTASGTRSAYRCSCHLPEENVLLEPQVQLRIRLDTFAAASCTEFVHRRHDRNEPRRPSRHGEALRKTRLLQTLTRISMQGTHAVSQDPFNFALHPLCSLLQHSSPASREAASVIEDAALSAEQGALVPFQCASLSSLAQAYPQPLPALDCQCRRPVPHGQGQGHPSARR